jgi:hypothetical protein
LAVAHAQEANRLIEQRFPINFVNQLAKHESWRKEVYRPIYALFSQMLTVAIVR